MKYTIKIFLSIIFCLFIVSNVSAKQFLPAMQMNSVIKKSDISKNAEIAVSIKDLKTGKVVYELNSKKPMNPASTQKIVTLIPSISSLGENYEFKTRLYFNKKNGNLYVKLGADPYLTTDDLKTLFSRLKNYKIVKIKSIYIDDSITDSNEWGEGWQWDDDMNPLMPKFGAYNLDKNLIGITVSPTVLGAPGQIETDVFYPTVFMKNIVTGSVNDIKLDRRNYISPDIINANGTVSSTQTIQVPINFPRRYFVLRLKEILANQKVEYYGEFPRAITSKGSMLIAETKHSISAAEDDILKSSNNMIAETVFKLAGGKYTNSEGSAMNSNEMLNNYYKKQGISTENVKIVDGSGVSKNNLLTSDFVSDVLVKESKDLNFKDFLSHMASPGEGTLTDRMLYFKENLKAKTGTLSNVSAICGYLTSKKGKTYAFSIMISDPKSKSSDKKSFEEYLLRNAYEAL